MIAVNKSLLDNIKYYYSDKCLKDIDEDYDYDRDTYISLFINIEEEDTWYQKEKKVNKFVNMLVDIINKAPRTNIIKTITDSLEELNNSYNVCIEDVERMRKSNDEAICNEIINTFNGDKPKYEVIENTSTHISSISKCLSDNINNYVYKDTINEDNIMTYKQLYRIQECINDDATDEEVLNIIEIKEYINEIKKADKDYALYMGHFMESVISSLLSKHYVTQLYKNTETSAIISTACKAVINEVYDKTCKDKSKEEKDEIMDRVNKFVKEIKETHYDKIVAYIDKCLSKQIELFIADIEQKLNVTDTSIAKMFAKINYSYRGVKGESDYLLQYPDKNITILVDCKYYSNIDNKTLLKFVYQLLGYYRQHSIMKTLPSYRKENNYDINYFMIISPLNNKLEFSYYLCSVDDDKLENMINEYESYLDKCLNSNEYCNRVIMDIMP